VSRLKHVFLVRTLDERDDYFLQIIGGKPPATDSASAATAMATGRKTDAGNIAWAPGDPADGAWETVAEWLRREHGFAIGVASTVPFDHATPAGFVSHNPSRNNYHALGHEIVFDVVPDVVIGGGNPDFYGGGGNDRYLASNDVYSLTHGLTSYTHVVTRETGVDGAVKLVSATVTISMARGDKLFGYFGGAGGNFEYHDVSDTPGSPAVTRGAVEDPTLAAVVTATLSVLNQDPDGFFVMFEQGDIDWSNHGNNFATMVGGIWDLDQAVRTAEAYVDRTSDMTWSDTLVIVTADHSNSYMRLPIALGVGDLPTQTVGMGGGWVYPGGEVTYATTRHTNELVTLWARGKGAVYFDAYAGQPFGTYVYTGTRIVDNTNFYDVVSRAAASGTEHIILFIGDGMNVNHEIAGSRYLYGEDFALAWHAWRRDVDGWVGFATTWDVNTYEKYASVYADGLAFDPESFYPYLGYDEARGGEAPSPLVGLPPDSIMPRLYVPLVLRFSAVAR
jgi:alkaline phosphatase